MIKRTSGFTLIELVVVMVVLGILAIVAIPNYIDMARQARQAATDGVSGALSSWGVIHYASCLAPSHSVLGSPIPSPGPLQVPTRLNCNQYAGTLSGVTVEFAEDDLTPPNGIAFESNKFYILDQAIPGGALASNIPGAAQPGSTFQCTVIHGDDPTRVQSYFTYTITDSVCK